MEEPPNTKLMQCRHCTKEFRYKSERKRHELSHFPRFECDTCCKKFSFVSALRRHEKQHERTGSVKCEQCNRKFRDDVLMKRHMKYAHKGTFICEKCNSRFSSEVALRTHMKSHKPESERRFKCSFKGCTKSFNFSHHLKHHELTHTNAKQHYCSVCGKGFIQSHHLKAHLKAHDPAEWLLCAAPGCNKKFSTEYARRRHMATHRNKPDSGISSDSNSCDNSVTSKDYNEESLLCAACGETLSKSNYHNHSLKCVNVNEDDITVDEWPHSPFQPQNESDAAAAKSIDKDMGDCNALLGDCIVNDDNCICAQMAKPINDNYDYLPIENNNVSDNNWSANRDKDSYFREIVDKSNADIVKIVPAEYIQSYDENKNVCAGCDCANTCNINVQTYCDITPKVINTAEPNIEYTIDGVVKIKETFDDDIVVNTEESRSERMPFTCKEVIGNCLVNGGDGCLCARMMADEDQAILAQEIDDITPQPKTE